MSPEDYEHGMDLNYTEQLARRYEATLPMADFDREREPDLADELRLRARERRERRERES